MIVRTWHGCVPLLHAEGFALHLRRTGVKHAKTIAGNQGAFVKQVIQNQWAHFFLATYWDDLSSIKAFAGDDYQIAVTYPDDEQYELISDPYVFHHAVSTQTEL
ncbi:hypothetical protein [Acinetobacter soli]|uniref:hypothetical protein n=1 Tax=Acinetobacter soli TaxID=487316 RepID=UPI00258E4E49|nr:hypothetical protein [uncultured Acinetobacter sp.]